MRFGLLAAVIALTGVVSATLSAQAPARLSVTVFDLTEQVVPGATVFVERTGAETRMSTTDAQGQAAFDGLPAGGYVVRASLAGFGDSMPVVVQTVRAGITRAQIRLGPPTANETVTVGGGASSTSPETTVDKSALPPDIPPEQDILQSTIDSLAGVGTTVRVDGLTSGGLPPASTIQAIRVRQNSFDAEYHEATPAFVEIITNGKPVPWQVNANTFARLEPLQARNAFNPDTPAAQQQGLFGNVNGNILQRASVVFFGNVNAQHEDQPLYAQLPSGPIRGLVNNPSHYTFATLRIGLDNWRHQDFRLEGDYQDQRLSNLGAGGFNLAERGYERSVVLGRLRGFWTKPFGHGASQVLRVQLQKQDETNTPASVAPAVVVLSAFTSGGAQNQGRRITDQAEVSDVVTVPIGKRQVWRSGLLFWHGGYDTTLVTNAGGTFTFSSLEAYVAGQPATFTQRVGAGVCCFGVSQLGVWTQDDIALSKTVNLAVGLRQESESDMASRTNLAPRAQLDWSPPRVPHTTFRIGSGIFYSWFNPNDIEQTVRVDGIHQQDLLIDNPPYPNLATNTIGAIPSGRYIRDPALELPRLIRSSVGLDHTRGALVLHTDFTHQIGTGLLRGHNLNAPDSAGVRPDPQFANVIDVQSAGRSRLEVANASATYSNPKHGIFVRLNYRFAYSYDNTDGPFFLPVDTANPNAEWGPAGQDIRHQFGGVASGLFIRRHLNATTYWQVSSATPYTITTGLDPNGDGIFNERPAGVGRNSARGFAQAAQGLFLSWQWPAVPAPPAKPPALLVSLGVSVNNLWNYVNRTAVSGVLASPYFGQPVAAGQPRRIYVGIFTTF